jgi:hypothetical protein
LSNARVVGGATSFRACAPHEYLFFSHAKSIFAGSSVALFDFFDFLKTKAAVRQMPTASTNAYRHAAEIGGHEGDMPWSAVSQESNQPDRSTEINVHGHG